MLALIDESDPPIEEKQGRYSPEQSQIITEEIDMLRGRGVI